MLPSSFASATVSVNKINPSSFISTTLCTTPESAQSPGHFRRHYSRFSQISRRPCHVYAVITIYYCTGSHVKIFLASAYHNDSLFKKELLSTLQCIVKQPCVQQCDTTASWSFFTFCKHESGRTFAPLLSMTGISAMDSGVHLLATPVCQCVRCITRITYPACPKLGNLRHLNYLTTSLILRYRYSTK